MKPVSVMRWNLLHVDDSPAGARRTTGRLHQPQGLESLADTGRWRRVHRQSCDVLDELQVGAEMRRVETRGWLDDLLVRAVLRDDAHAAAAALENDAAGRADEFERLLIVGCRTEYVPEQRGNHSGR